MSENPKYTIDRQPVRNLQVTLSELGIVLETPSGKIKRDDALEMALSAMSNSQQKKEEAVYVIVQTGSLRIYLHRLISFFVFYPAPLFSHDALLQSFFRRQYGVPEECHLHHSLFPRFLDVLLCLVDSAECPSAAV